MVTDLQVKKLWRVYEQTGKINTSALKSGMDRETARKYINDRRLPSEIPKNRSSATKSEEIDKVWPFAEEFLKVSPDLEAKALFDHLVRQFPETLDDNQLRTFQRRVKNWRLKFGADKEVYFDQIIEPGKNAQLDWLDMNAFKITIAGVHLKHKLCHFVLNYSNYESVTRCRSESTLSIKKGIKEFLYSIGHIPEILQVDNSSAATHRIDKNAERRDFNEEYLAILNYYGIKAKKNNVGKPNENGDVESQNGHLKKRIKQELLLRNSCDFKSLESYDQFIKDVLKKTNKKRMDKLEEELKTMGTVPKVPLLEYQELYVTVRNRSTVHIKKVTYSVPSKLIGTKLKAKIFEDRIELLSGADLVYTMDRSLGDRGQVINYRHVIHSLVRKPGAFSNYKYREEMYPTAIFKITYEKLLKVKGERSGVLDYLRILKLAADNMESDVEAALELLMDGGVPVYDEVLELINNKNSSPIESIELYPDLNFYDQLLEEQKYVH